MSVRSEQEIFADLEKLCSSPGYIHAIACFCFRDNSILYKEDVTAKDMEHLSSPEGLIRSEISTLVGLLIKKKINYELPSLDTLQQYLDRTESLLKEMHCSIAAPMLDPKNLTNKGIGGEVLREQIFYGSESAYDFQYRELSPKKYARDDKWIKENKGFSIKEAGNVVHTIGKIQSAKLENTLNGFKKSYPDKWTFLPGFTFTTQEIAKHSGIKISLIRRVLSTFALSGERINQDFCSLNDFNVFSASPVISAGDDRFIILQTYILFEALYEGPFYWMQKDERYIDTASHHRGQFPEEFCKDQLELVFGKDNVYPNIDILEAENKKLGEIDVLVIYGNRAIVVQAKSKRMTLQAKKGHDGQIKEDFKKSIQDSYDQAFKCAELLIRNEHRFVDGASKEIAIPSGLKEIFILCVVSDHYPALNSQTQQFLKYEETETIYPPFVMNVFTLDVMTEFLHSPLRLLSYIKRRASYFDKVFASDELRIFGHHLKNNLWIEKNRIDWLFLDGGSGDLDLAMYVRRAGIPGKRTPDGILTYFSATPLGRIIEEIEAQHEPAAIDLGFMLLTLSERSILDINKYIKRIASKASSDRNHHDCTMLFKEGSAGLTVHCNYEPLAIACDRLIEHCAMRKYKQKVNSWFGICIHPENILLRFVCSFDHKWEQNSEMDVKTSHVRNLNELAPTLVRKEKIGRNKPCPCGSGRKYKQCCGK